MSNYLNSTIIDAIGSLTADNLIYRVSRLLNIGKDKEAKALLEKALMIWPADNKLMELESECSCFLMRDFGYYLKMLAAKTFFCGGIEKRYETEIKGFCSMLSKNADRELNLAVYRKINIENYNFILGYLSDLKKCLQNSYVIEKEELYKVIVFAVLKLTTVVCNTIYKVKGKKNHDKNIMLIDLNVRRKLAVDFEKVRMVYGDCNFTIVDERIVKKYTD